MKSRYRGQGTENGTAPDGCGIIHGNRFAHGLELLGVVCGQAKGK